MNATEGDLSAEELSLHRQLVHADGKTAGCWCHTRRGRWLTRCLDCAETPDGVVYWAGDGAFHGPALEHAVATGHGLASAPLRVDGDQDPVEQLGALRADPDDDDVTLLIFQDMTDSGAWPVLTGPVPPGLTPAERVAS